MGCDISREQLWSLIDGNAPDLEEHLAQCLTCRARAQVIRQKIQVIASRSSVAIPLPDKIGSYTVKRLLGEGGQAHVYEAEQDSPRRLVALKVLKGGRFAGEKLVKHFQRESQALAKLKHPAIATIYEAGCSAEGLHYFAMELVGGKPLHQYVREGKPARQDRLALFAKICRAVSYAHRHGVIHRDLKPSNIIIEKSGEPKILDFGLARVAMENVPLTVTRTKAAAVAGTPCYMSPEQARGKPSLIDERSDVYALGVMLYELLAGRPPHDISNLTPESLRTLCEEPAPPPSSVDDTVSKDLETIVLKALEKRLERRYRTVVDLLEDLRRYQEAEPILARPPGMFYRARRKLSRHRLWFGVGAVVVVNLLLALWIAGRTPFDIAEARRDLIRSRCDMLARGMEGSGFPRALNATGSYPGLLEAKLIKAQAYFIRREPHLAIQYLESELARDVMSWPLQILLDEITLQERRPEGLETNDTLTEIPRPDSAESWYLRSFATLDIRHALAWAEEAVRREPDHIPGLMSMTLLSEVDDDIEGAVFWAKKLAEADGTGFQWSIYRIDKLADLGRYAEALAVCDTLVVDYKGVFALHESRAKVLRRLGRYGEATAGFTTAIESVGRDDPRSTWLFYHRGTLNMMLGRMDAAEADYRQAYRSLTYATYANARLYLVLCDLGSTDEAHASLADARQNVWNDPWLEKILACLAGEMSGEQLVAAASGPKQRCEALYYAGEVDLLLGRTAEAMARFKACIETGYDTDPLKAIDPMSEYELAGWRLRALTDEGGVSSTGASSG